MQSLVGNFVDIRTHEVTAAFSPDFTFADVSHHCSDGSPSGEKVASHFATDVAGNPSNCEHWSTFSFTRSEG
jgi:hypothetical protein